MGTRGCSHDIHGRHKEPCLSVVGHHTLCQPMQSLPQPQKRRRQSRLGLHCLQPHVRVLFRSCQPQRRPPQVVHRFRAQGNNLLSSDAPCRASLPVDGDDGKSAGPGALLWLVRPRRCNVPRATPELGRGERGACHDTSEEFTSPSPFHANVTWREAPCPTVDAQGCLQLHNPPDNFLSCNGCSFDAVGSTVHVLFSLHPADRLSEMHAWDVPSSIHHACPTSSTCLSIYLLLLVVCASMQ
jgi:hypothetical protein